MPEWLTRKYGPLPAWQWAALGAVGYFGYRWWKNRQSANAALAGPAAGGTIPGASVQSSGSPLPSTLAQWQQDALAFGQDPISTLNAVTNWLAGNCVDPAGYGGLTAAIGSLGLPPGFTNYPVLTVCPGSTPGGSSAGSGAGGSGSSGGGTGGTPAATGGGSTAPAPNLAAILQGVAYHPAAYPGAPQIGTFTVPAFPAGAVNPYGVATPGPGGQVEVVGNTAVGSEPYWQVANNAAIAAGQPLPFPHGPVA